jgi:protein disulfide-isomerase A6
MKQAWEDLGTAFEGSNSVVIGDTDCTVETELCSQYDVRGVSHSCCYPPTHTHTHTHTHDIGARVQQVSGYPTIKYFTAETDPKGDSYSGGRDLPSLKAFVEEKLERKCDPSDPTTCSEKEQKFITTMVRACACVRACVCVCVRACV